MALAVGDRITVRRAVEAYYSGYAGQPVQCLEPGVVATVVRVNVPAVTTNRTFALVHFEGRPLVSNPPTSIWSAAVYPENVKRL